MTNHQLHVQAEREWNGSLTIRHQYPTFVFFWHERYERVYNIPTKEKHQGNTLNALH